jgi:LysM repeat protein
LSSDRFHRRTDDHGRRNFAGGVRLAKFCQVDVALVGKIPYHPAVCAVGSKAVIFRDVKDASRRTEVNAIKNILVIAVLAVVACAVYATINNNSGQTPPPGGSESWPPAVDMGTPVAQDAKSGPKNPFAVAGSKSTESVTAKDAPLFSGARANQAGLPKSASAAAAGVRPERDVMGPLGKLAAAPGGPADRWPAAGPGSPEMRPGEQPPGVAGATDLPVGSAAPIAPGRQASRPDASQTARAAEVRKRFAELMEDAQRELRQGEYAKVHLKLSQVYEFPDLAAEESRQLTEILDQLAGTVIYSRQHLLEPAYVVKAGETLPQIAERYNVPWQLLAKINGIRDPDRLPPGRSLKVVRGPFDAVISLDRFEMVLMVGGCYAGRFPIGTGRDLPQREGSFIVKRKSGAPGESGPGRGDDLRGSGNSPSNYVIELSDRVAIQGTNDAKRLRRSDNPGSICLGPRDIGDVYDILSADSASSPGSKITIRR